MDLQFGDFTLRHRDRQLAGPGGPADLSARSFDILNALLGRPGELVSKDELLDAVWPGVTVEDNTLQVHVAQLRKALDPAMIVTVHGRGYKYVGPNPTAAAVQPPVREADRKPVIAVLPFENLSGDAEQQYFSDGITGDIIDRLARYRILAVIGHQSTFAMRGREADLAALRDKLGADYVVTGNLRKAGNRIRVAARLADATSGNAVWSQHYDRPLEDVFAVQDEVAALIASTLMGRVEVEAASRKPTAGADFTSYELVLKGIWHFKRLTVPDNERATELFKAALAVNPANAEALRWLSSCHVNRWFMGHDRNELRASVEMGRRAAELDPASAMCHTAHAFALLWAEGCDAAAAVYRRAVQANPDDPNVMAEIGLLEIYSGNFDKGRSMLDLAEILNPVPPLWYGEFRAIGAFAEGRYADALPGFAAIPSCVFDTCYVVACLGHLGDRNRLEAVMDRVRQSGWDVYRTAAAEPFRNEEPRRQLKLGIAKAYALLDP